jgi:hypothetical protein
MVSSSARAGFALSVSVLVAVACSKDAKKSARETPDAGGEAEGGEAAASAGENAGGATTGAGGDMTGAPTDGWLSGTRLRAVLDVAGSAKLFRFWHDQGLDIDCDFAVDSGGTERCLPLNRHGSFVYSDGDCQLPVALFSPDDELPPYVPEPTGPFECGKGARYFQLGGDVTGVTALFLQTSAGCMPNGAPGSNELVKSFAAAVPDTTFVAAAKTLTEPREARLSANVRVAADGSRLVTSHEDLERSAICNPREHATDTFACIPEDRAYVEVYFADDTCQTPAAFHPGYAQQVCGREPTIVQNSSPFFTDGYFEIGKQLSGTVYRQDGPVCDVYDAPAELGATFYAVGKEVPFSDFPPLSLQTEGASRVRVNVLRGADGELISREELYDTELKAVCGVALASDGQPHCVPRTPYSVNVYADVNCETALFSVGASEVAPPSGTFMTAAAPGGGEAVFKLGAKIATPKQAFQRNGLDCQSTTLLDGQDYYAMTTLAPAELAEVAREVE